MPSEVHNKMSDDDAKAIVAYLRTVKPVHNQPKQRLQPTGRTRLTMLAVSPARKPRRFRRSSGRHCSTYTLLMPPTRGVMITFSSDQNGWSCGSGSLENT